MTQLLQKVLTDPSARSKQELPVETAQLATSYMPWLPEA